MKKVGRQTNKAGLGKSYRQILRMLVDAVTFVENDHRGPLAFTLGQSTHGADAAAVFDHRSSNSSRFLRGLPTLPLLTEIKSSDAKTRQAYPGIREPVKQALSLVSILLSTYIHPYESQGRNKRRGRSHNDGSEDRAAENGGTSLCFFPRLLLRVVVARQRKALVPEYAKKPVRRRDRARDRFSAHGNVDGRGPAARGSYSPRLSA